MNKTDLVDAIAAGANLSKANAASALDATINAITKAVASGESVVLVGFGSFKAVERAARKGRIPKTREPIDIPATVTPKFTAGASFKAAVAKTKKK